MADDPELALILKIIWRLIVVTFGFCVAIVSVAIVLAIAIGQDLSTTIDTGDAADLAHHAIRGFFLVLALAFTGFIPWVIGTIVAELLQFRSIFYHLGLGAISGAVAGVFNSISDTHTLQMEVATGLVAGGVYWLIAGRSAGDWWPRHVEPLYTRSPPPPPPRF